MVTNKLRVILAEKGIKQTWLCEKVEISKQTMSGIVSNRYNTSLEAAMKIAKALDMKVDDIFQLDEEEQEK